jgi:Iap family predicted aminopeptidase
MQPLVSLLAALLAPFAAVGQTPLDASFQERAMAHVRALAGFGNRLAGSAGETQAAQYLRTQLREAGLASEVEPFEFRSFELRKASLVIGQNRADVLRLVADPYASAPFAAPVEFVTPEVTDDWERLSRLPLRDKLVATTGRANAYRFAARRARAVAYLAGADFERLRPGAGLPGDLIVDGSVVTVRSANLAALLPGEGPEIVLSAHYDSVRTPGANDNASGAAVLLELARYYRRQQHHPHLRILFFGAEEEGLVGAKAYLARHLDDLKNSALLFNMDSVGGDGALHVEMRGGVRGVAGRGVNQIPANVIDKAEHDVDGKWQYIPPRNGDLSNVPPWLQDALRASAAEAKIEITPSNQMGSDHQVFAQAGIPSTNVAAGGGRNHTPDDTPAHITPASLQNAARLIVGVVARVPRD